LTTLDPFGAAELPTDAEEIWRYSRISELDLTRFTPATAVEPVDGSMPDELRPLVGAIGERAALILTRNGLPVSSEIQPNLLEVVSPAESDAIGAVAGDADAFVTMNARLAPHPNIVRIPKGAVVDDPIVLVHWIDSDGIAVFPRTVIEAGEASAATVIEVVASPDVLALAVPVTEITVGPAANLRYVNVQQLGPRAWQVAYQASQVDSQATLLSAAVAIGGDYARVRTDSRLVGAGASGNLIAVYFGNRTQMHDFRTLQDHNAPKTSSNLLFKGAVAGAAHSVYSGLIRVHPGAKGTNAFQTNRNLVLSEGARADSVPNLEIEENEVACSHASAVGPVDEEQRYYLESRGVPTEVADRLIVLGFLKDVVERLPPPGLQRYLHHVLADKLDRSETNLLGGAA
jgi:Fe-S cluster assembly protein SufD